MIVECGDIESNPGPGSDRRVRVLYSNFRALHVNLDELAVAGSDYDVLVCSESNISDRHHLLELRIPGFGCPQQRLSYSTPGYQGMALFVVKDFDASGRASWCVLATSPVCFAFALCTIIFYIYAFFCNPGHDGSLFDCLLDTMARVQSVDDKAVFFVDDANAHDSEWVGSVSPTDRMGVMLLIFFKLAGYEQFVR